MSNSKYPNPPEGTHICGGSWEIMPEESREEVWLFSTYLSEGGKKAHGSFDEWRDKRRTIPAGLPHGTENK